MPDSMASSWASVPYGSPADWTTSTGHVIARQIGGDVPRAELRREPHVVPSAERACRRRRDSAPAAPASRRARRPTLAASMLVTDMSSTNTCGAKSASEVTGRPDAGSDDRDRRAVAVADEHRALDLVLGEYRLEHLGFVVHVGDRPRAGERRCVAVTGSRVDERRRTDRVADSRREVAPQLGRPETLVQEDEGRSVRQISPRAECVPQLETTDLAGRRLRQCLDDDDPAGPLEGGHALAAMRLERGGVDGAPGTGHDDRDDLSRARARRAARPRPPRARRGARSASLSTSAGDTQMPPALIMSLLRPRKV